MPLFYSLIQSSVNGHLGYLHILAIVEYYCCECVWFLISQNSLWLHCYIIFPGLKYLMYLAISKNKSLWVLFLEKAQLIYHNNIEEREQFFKGEWAGDQ